MHLTGLNVPQLLLSLWRGTIDCQKPDSTSTWDWMVLTGDFWEEHGEVVESFRRFLPGTFDRPLQNPAKKINSGYKAREFLLYVFGYLPGLLYGVLPLPYWQNFCKLARGVRIILQHSLTSSDLDMAFDLLTKFVVEFEVLYVQRKVYQVHFIPQCLHNILHLPPDTRRCGPLSLESQWTIERVIGYLGAEVKQPSNPFKNLSERGLRQAQLSALMAMAPDKLVKESNPLGVGGVNLGDHFLLKRPHNTKQYPLEGAERVAASQYCERTFPCYQSFAYSERHLPIFCWARLGLPTQQTGRTSWKECMKSPDAALRTSRMVKVR